MAVSQRFNALTFLIIFPVSRHASNLCLTRTMLMFFQRSLQLMMRRVKVLTGREKNRTITKIRRKPLAL